MKVAWTYQLVLQFTATSMDDFDELVAVEEQLIKHLSSFALVDGHDFGQSEFNIFILTDEPVFAFKKAREVIQNGMRVAYRPIDGDDYVILWPPDLIEFSVA